MQERVSFPQGISGVRDFWCKDMAPAIIYCLSAGSGTDRSDSDSEGEVGSKDLGINSHPGTQQGARKFLLLAAGGD